MASIAPGTGLGFGPRHLDFHPTEPWVYVSIERQNKLYVYELQPDGGLGRDPMFVKETLADPANVQAGHRAPGRSTCIRTAASSISPTATPASSSFARHRWSPTAARATSRCSRSIGRPASRRLIQTVDGPGNHLRTFAIDPSGRLLVAATIGPLPVRDGNAVKTLPAGLFVYRVGGRRQARLRAQIRRRHRRPHAVLERDADAGIAG